MKLANKELSQVSHVRDKVEANSTMMDNIVNDIISKYVDDLDKYVSFIKDILQDGENPPTDRELDDFCLNMSVYIYFASGMCEQLGIRDDISKALYKEVYNNARDGLTDGTVADKNVTAELMAQEEQLISIAYTRAYKIVKAKVENAQELLSACKKVLSRRMSEQQLTNITGGN